MTTRSRNTDIYLHTAAEIGERLVREAIWHEQRCNWMGALPKDPRSRGTGADSYRALGPDLYLGTSGVALFLAQLHQASGDAAVRHTALGALRQALDFADSQPQTNCLGLFSGWMGIAFAAARVGVLLGEDELRSAADRLARRALREGKDEEDFDLVYGKAGALVAALALRELLAQPSLTESVISLGDGLLRSAQRADEGYSWKSAALPTARNLTGFSHGTAGAGYALLELFRVTGDARYREGAEEAFRYERHWFDAEAGNWPDFREQSARGARRRQPSVFSTYWCHGAAGIALSRLRAYDALRDPVCATEARTALQTTQKAVETALESGMGNHSLCHGLGGNVEALLYGEEVLGSEWIDATPLACRVADAGIERYAARAAAWPCGAGGGETPGLMLGLAGIGFSYLRLYDPAIPSVLLVQPENYAH